MAEKEAKQKDFFAAMERNILKNLNAGAFVVKQQSSDEEKKSSVVGDNNNKGMSASLSISSSPSDSPTDVKKSPGSLRQR